MPQLSKQLVSQRSGQAIIEHLHAKTQEEEARMVVEKILELKSRPSTGSGTNREGSHSISNFQPPTPICWSDFAILVRANSQAEIFCQALEQAGIPYQFLASSGLFSKPIILDILAYLKLLDNYHESSALYRILNLPVFKIDLKDIVDLNYWARRKNWSLYETLRKASSLNISKESLAEIDKILSLIEKHAQLAREKSVGKVVFAFLEDTGYLKLLTNLYESTTNNIRETSGKFVNIRENLNYINQFFRKIEEFERRASDKSIKAFQEEIEMAREAGEEGSLEQDIEEGPEAVKIMTVHGAKGLEFRYVFVVNLVDRRFPTAERKEAIELPDALVKEIIPEGDIHLQEERRLFYVAMTRAKDGLFFTSAEDYGGQRKKRLSRFLEEAIPHLLKKGVKSSQGLQAEREEQRIPRSKEEFIKRYSTTLPRRLHQEFKTLCNEIPKKFSFTQLKAFETCPLQYKFAHILHIPVKGRFTFSFGKSMHNTLHRFFQRWIEGREKEQRSLFENKISTSWFPKLEELLNIYESVWIDDWYDSKAHQEEYKEKGRRLLREFYEIIKKDPPSPKYLELGFNFRLGDYTIKGVMDRVDLVNLNSRISSNEFEDVRGKPGGVSEKVEIIDYKTGKVRDEETLSNEDKEQLLIYQLAAQDVLKEEVVRLSYYYLEENKKISFLGTEKELEAMKNKIIQTIEEIKKSDFPAQPNTFKCSFCDFKEICEYRAV
jgi:DNA helicase-2/ATP-dependent DNA helicase PcrA